MTNKAAGTMVVPLIFNFDGFSAAKRGGGFGGRGDGWKASMKRPDVARPRTKRNTSSCRDAT